MLDVRGLSVSFSGVHALQSADFSVATGSVTALIGPNGAGKTTAFNCISRIQEFDSGTIRLAGDDLRDRSAADLVSLGVARTFQHSALFRSMTVRDNLRIGERAGATRRRAEQATSWSLDDVVDWLGIGDELDRNVGSLSLGTQKRVELGRALATRPRFLMLDEPAGGLIHEDVVRLSTLLRDLRTHFDVTVLIVEHNMAMVMTLSDHVVVLSAGRTIAAGPPDEVRADREVQRVYLGA